MSIDFTKIYNDFLSWFVVTVVGGLVTWIVTLRRKVNTNEKLLEQNKLATDAQFALVLQRLDQRDLQREEDRESVGSLVTDVRELRQGVQDIKNALIHRD